MKDYRTLLCDVTNLVEDILDHPELDQMGLAYTRQEIAKLDSDLIDMFNELDAELEGGERF